MSRQGPKNSPLSYAELAVLAAAVVFGLVQVVLFFLN